MGDCYICLPTCDNCRPKLVECPGCGRSTLIDLDTCPLCKSEITEEARQRAWDAWRKTHATDDASQ